MSPADRHTMMLAGPIVPTILALAAPNVLNVAMMSLVSIFDSWFVSQLGIVDLAALALVFPTQMALGQMSAGAMGGGISSSVARALGSGDRAAAEAAAAHALVIALGMAALFAVVFVGFGLPALGIRGPAIASVISFTLAAVWMASRLLGPQAVLKLHWPKGGFRWASFRDILKVGLIACLVVILTNSTVLVVTGLIGRAGDAAIAGYGIGSRLEYMLVPISFGVGATLTTLVGTNIGARQYDRAKRLAWIGALMTGAIAAAIGLVVAIWPDLWLGLFTSDAGALASGRTYLSIVGPVYGFFGLAMALYFASQGTGEMVWPVVANLSRITIAVCGSLLALDVLGWGVRGLFTFVALGIVSFSAVLAFSTTRRAWGGA